jgi:Lipid A 3-O-deacylase (PagL)
MNLKTDLNRPMNSVARKFLFAFLCILISPLMVMAQDSVYPDTQRVVMPRNAGMSLDPGTSQVGVWAGYSSSNPTLIGRSTDRPFFEFNVQYARVLRTGDNWSMKYIAEIIPAAITKQPRQGTDANGNTVDLPGRERIYGAGVSPVGLQMNFRRGYALQPYVNGTAGVLYFTRNVPVADSSNFNFIFGFGVGVEIWHRDSQSLIIGYKYQHISNGYTAPRNPGLDSNLLYVGYAWSWKQ